MLSPETTKALAEALDAVIEQAGDDPDNAALVEALGSARDALPEGERGPDQAEDADADAPAKDADERDAEDDDFSFETAKKRLTNKRAAKKGVNPFAKGDEGDAA